MLEEYKTEEALVKYVASLTMITHDEMLKIAGDGATFWPVFEEKISAFFPLLAMRDVFVSYSEYTLRKFIKNGYDRVEFRAFLTKIKTYDEKGAFIKEHD